MRLLKKREFKTGLTKRGLAGILAFSMLTSVLSTAGMTVGAADIESDETSATMENTEISAAKHNNFYTGPYDVDVEKYNFLDNQIAVNATYFDYLSDKEYDGSYLNPFQAGTGYVGSEDNWYPFYKYNRVIKNVASEDSNWKKPLYFGNFCNTSGAYDTSIHGGNYENAKNSYNVINFDYVPNNSNGLSNYYKSYLGLAYKKLNANNDLMATSTTKMPYFDGDLLSKNFDSNGNAVPSGGKRIARIFKSYFPFNVRQEANGATTYYYDSTEAKDNIYFTWSGSGNNAKPTAINYGAGKTYGVEDGLKYFMNGATSGYGIFPFNNKIGSNGGNNNLDYGFGMRLDIDFNVTETGTVDGQEGSMPIQFNYLGDDDIWIYVSDDLGNSELVLDLGGNHKKTSGSINFQDMYATVNDAQNVSGMSEYKAAQRKVADDEIWINPNDGGVNADLKMYLWNNSSDKKTIQPRTTINGYYVFKKSQLEGYANCIFFCSDKGIDDKNKITGDLTVSSDWYGKCLTINNGSVSEAKSNFSTTVYTKTFNGGKKFDSARTYHMTVFYMERGLLESNFTVDFTFISASDQFSTNKTVKLPTINGGIRSDVLNVVSKEEFDIRNEVSSNASIGYQANNDKVGTLIDANESVGEVTTSLQGYYKIKDKDSVTFNKYANVGNYVQITENKDNAVYTYDTSTIITDNENERNIQNMLNSGETARFKYENSINPKKYTDYNVEFINSLVTQSLTVSKNVVNDDTNTDEFTFKILFDVDGSNSDFGYKAYSNVAFTKTQKDYNKKEQYTGADGTFKLKAGEKVEFKNIPVGVKYKVVEETPLGYVSQPEQTGSIENGYNNSVTFNNKKNISSNVDVDILINKYVDGDFVSIDDSGKFTFKIEKMDENASGQLVTEPAESSDVIEVINDGSSAGCKFNYDYNYVPEPTEAPATQPTTVKPTTQPTTAEPTTQPTTAKPTQPTTVARNILYFNDKAIYTTDARFAAYFFIGNNPGVWVNMTKVADNIYAVEVPSGYVNQSVIFCRMNGSTTSNTWSNCWNQTNDLSMSNSYNYYVASGWGGGNKFNGSWQGKYTGSATLKNSSPLKNATSVKSNIDYYYYKISEIESDKKTWKYDKSEIYAKVTVISYEKKTSQNDEMEAFVEYYKFNSKPVKTSMFTDEYKISDECADFYNFHNSSVTVNKTDANGKVISDGVKFKLYKVTGDKASISDTTPVVDTNGDVITNTKSYTGESIAKGSVTFDNLDIFVNQKKGEATTRQWYCLVESQSKDGFVVNSSKNYFTLPVNNVYHTSTTVANFPLSVPATSGEGRGIFVRMGLTFMLTSTLMAGAYILFVNRKKFALVKNIFDYNYYKH